MIKVSDETKEKISKTMLAKGVGFKKGYIPWNKGKKASEETRLKHSEAARNSWKNGKRTGGYKLGEDQRKNISIGHIGVNTWMKGRKATPELRKKLSEIQKKRVEDGNHNFWKGGVTGKNTLIRSSVDYKIWRESVFKRDDFTCQDCGVRGLKIQAHHIKPFALFPELRFEIENGMTLCKECHMKTDTYLKNPSKLMQGLGAIIRSAEGRARNQF